jgi:hypothetical protein
VPEYWSIGKEIKKNYLEKFFNFLLGIIPISFGLDNSITITPLLPYSITPKLTS